MHYECLIVFLVVTMDIGFERNDSEDWRSTAVYLPHCSDVLCI